MLSFLCVVKKHLREFAVFLRCGKIVETKAVGPQNQQTPSSTLQQNEKNHKMWFSQPVSAIFYFLYFLAGRMFFCIFSRVVFFRMFFVLFLRAVFLYVFCIFLYFVLSVLLKIQKKNYS